MRNESKASLQLSDVAKGSVPLRSWNVRMEYNTFIGQELWNSLRQCPYIDLYNHLTSKVLAAVVETTINACEYLDRQFVYVL